jgi:hypothetical protein
MTWYTHNDRRALAQFHGLYQDEIPAWHTILLHSPVSSTFTVLDNTDAWLSEGAARKTFAYPDLVYNGVGGNALRSTHY